LSEEPGADTLGWQLLERGLLTEDSLQQAVEEFQLARACGAEVAFEEILVRRGLVTPAQIEQARAGKFAAPAKAGPAIPGYELLDLIGRGAMGEVYRARQVAVDREVAVKILKPDLMANERAVERFGREAKILGRLSHPNIVQGIDAGSAHGLHYYVMELFDAENLKEILRRRRRLPLDESLDIARQTARALAHAAALSIVHRDVKPENIMVAADGTVKVTDFGIAKILAGPAEAGLTQTGFTMGTPQYMSPEQAAGEPDLDARCDVYALGVVIYEMLAGEQAFPGRNAGEVLAAKLRVGVPVDRLARAGIPARVVALVEKMTAHDRARRHRTLEELVNDLERGLPSTPAVSPTRRITRRTAAVVASSRPVRARSSLDSSLWIAAGAAALLVVAGLAFFGRGSWRPRKPVRPPAVEPIDADEPVEIARPTPIPKAQPPAPAKPKLQAPPPAPEPANLVWERALEVERLGDPARPDEILLGFVRARPRLSGTEWAEECDRRIAVWSEAAAADVARAGQELEAEVDAALAKGRFGAAREAVSKAAGRFAGAELEDREPYAGYARRVRGQRDRVETALARTVEGVRREAGELALKHEYEAAKKRWAELRANDVPAVAAEADLRIAELDRAEAERARKLEGLEKTETAAIQRAWAAGLERARARDHAGARAAFEAAAPALEHPAMRERGKRLLEGFALAQSVVDDVSKRFEAGPEIPASTILTRYRSATQTAEAGARPLARFLFALFDGDLRSAEAEQRRLAKGEKLEPEWEALLAELRRREEERLAREKQAQEIFRAAGQKLRSPATEEQGIEIFRKLQAEYSDVLTSEQREVVRAALAAAAYAWSPVSGVLRHWFVVGTFPFDRERKLSEQAFEPETEPLDLEARIRGTRARGGSRWVKHEANEGGTVEPGEDYARENRILYAACLIASGTAQGAVLRLHAPDGIEAWCNGKKVLADGTGSASPSALRVALEPGVNVLLIKLSLSGRGGRWWWKASVDRGPAISEATERRK
jgi:serine/threonine protein kinase